MNKPYQNFQYNLDKSSISVQTIWLTVFSIYNCYFGISIERLVPFHSNQLYLQTIEYIIVRKMLSSIDNNNYISVVIMLCIIMRYAEVVISFAFNHNYYENLLKIILFNIAIQRYLLMRPMKAKRKIIMNYRISDEYPM